MSNKTPLGITDVVLRDAHQSLFATRLRLNDMLPIAEKLDRVGFWSLETWGGATFDACIRFLGEDPWERLRALKKAMPNTRQQMLFRGQNILGYRHYADDIVDKFVERAAVNGIDVFRIFDAMNDPRNLEAAISAVRKQGRHAQGALSYTLSPVHDMDAWISMGKRIEAMGADSIAIKDMAGLLAPYVAFELVSRLKKETSLPIHIHCHATTGMSTATYLKAIEAGADNVDTAISSMSMTYGHSSTESLVTILQDTARDTGLDISLLEEIAAYFREVRQKYAEFEGEMRGVDARILVAQVPGGMLTNLERQLKEQNATDRMHEVLVEIPKVRKDLGFIPLVTPTSQIVGTQAVLNVLSGKRYQNLTKETRGILKGAYGTTPAPVNTALQTRALDGSQPVSGRPADTLAPEFEKLKAELLALKKDQDITFGDHLDEDVLTYALFPQPGLKFLANRNNPDAFEPEPAIASTPTQLPNAGDPEVYTLEVQGQRYVVSITPGGDIASTVPVPTTATATATTTATATATTTTTSPLVNSILAPLAGNIFRINVAAGDLVQSGEVVLILEAMKMETEIRATSAGHVKQILVREGASVAAGDALLILA